MSSDCGIKDIDERVSFCGDINEILLKVAWHQHCYSKKFLFKIMFYENGREFS